MALTREERQAIEKLTKKVRNLETTTASQQRLIDMLLEIVNRMDNATNMAEWTQEQWSKFLKPFLSRSNRTTGVAKHDHTNDQNGGDCFAKLGANLINGDE